MMEFANKIKTCSKSLLVNIILIIILSGFSNDTSAQLFSSVKSDKETGAKMDKQVKEQIGLYDEGGLTEYLNSIGQRVVKQLHNSKFDFQFKIVEQREPNAFAIPGGYVYFSRGILPLANSEDDLACVLGHEITHVTERHSSKQAERGVFGNILKIPGRIVGSFVNEDLGNIINSPINVMGKIGSSSYSRKHESEADEIGMKLASKAGYNPTHLGTMLRQIEKDVEMQTGHKSEFSFFNSHPMTEDRVEEINNEAKKLIWTPKQGISKDNNSFLERLDGLCLGENPGAGIFREEQFMHPDLGFTITFPKNWRLINTPSAVGAYTEKQDGAIFIDGIGKAVDPVIVGKLYEDKLRKEHKVIPAEAKEAELNSYPAYYIKIVDNSGEQTTYYYYLWVTMGNLTYSLIAGGLDTYFDILKQTVFSLKPITREERKSITIKRLRIVEAKDGETLEELGQRTGNIWNPEYTAMINSIDSEKLKEGQLIKIAKKEFYKTHK